MQFRFLHGIFKHNIYNKTIETNKGVWPYEHNSSYVKRLYY